MTTTKQLPSVLITDKGYNQTIDRFNALNLSEAKVTVGLWNRDVDRYGVRIANRAYVQNSPRGAAPGWITKAGEAMSAAMDRGLPILHEAIVFGTAQPFVMMNQIGAAMRDAYRAVIVASGLVETGDMLRAVDYEAPGKVHVPHTAGEIVRNKTTAEGMSAAQHLFQIYHKGRTAQAGEFRRKTSFKSYREQYESKLALFRAKAGFNAAFKGRSVAPGGLGRLLTAGITKAKRAHGITKGGQAKGSRAAWVGYVLGGGK